MDDEASRPDAEHREGDDHEHHEHAIRVGLAVSPLAPPQLAA
ncbi:hypothetical protein [Salana multivorans]|nr:hypothetical protein [Salana multivorans]